ncbi:MAG: hypothetical protein ACYTJ0_05750 [Planctomycetota bacterium]|jgi:hypothetical protein
MRVFWSLLAVLVLAAAGVLAFGRGFGGDAAAPSVTPPPAAGGMGRPRAARPATSGSAPVAAEDGHDHDDHDDEEPERVAATTPDGPAVSETTPPTEAAPPPTEVAATPTETATPAETAAAPTETTPPTEAAPPTEVAATPTETATPAETAAAPTETTPPTEAAPPTEVAATPTKTATPAETAAAPTETPPPTEAAPPPTEVAATRSETAPSTGTAGEPDAADREEAARLAAELLAAATAREAEEAAETTRPAGVETIAAEPAAGPAEADTTTAAPAGLVKQDDGSWLVDDRFVLRGSGSADDPYRVSWEHLVAAVETYQPRKGKKEIPAWVQMLHGTHVKLTGYLAFPLASQTVDEALIMLNQWDGCCIGVPPSPYDGVEVRLGKAIELKEGHFFRFGSVTGEFKVDPYLVNDWLVGLYLIEEASLDVGM